MADELTHWAFDLIEVGVLGLSTSPGRGRVVEPTSVHARRLPKCTLDQRRQVVESEACFGSDQPAQPQAAAQCRQLAEVGT